MAEAIVNIGANTGQATAAVEDLNNTLNQTGAATRKANANTDELTGNLNKQQATIKILDGAINILGGSVELAASAAIGLGLASEEDTKQFEAAALGAIAFAEGASRTLNGVVTLTEGITEFGGVQKIATALTNAFGVALKIAMGPVGIAIAAIGVITAAIVLLRDKFEAVNKVAQFFGNIFQSVAEFVGLAKTETEKFAEAQGELAKTLDFELKLLKAQGASIDQLVQKERELLTAKVNATKEGTEERIKAEQELALFEARVITEREARETAAAEKRKAAEEKRAQERFDILNKENVRKQKEIEDHLANVERLEKESDERRISDRIAIQEYFDDLDAEAFQATLDDLEKRKAAGQKRLDDEQKILDAIAYARDANFANLSATVGALGSLFEEGTAGAKAAAIADIAIGTAQGFINGLVIAQKAAAAAPAGTGALIFPLFYAAQIASVLAAANQAKQILATTPGGGAGGSVQKPSIPGAPSFGGASFTGGLPGTGGAAPTFGSGRQEPIRAYVISQDVTTGQEATAAINRRRRLGPG